MINIVKKYRELYFSNKENHKIQKEFYDYCLLLGKPSGKQKQLLRIARTILNDINRKIQRENLEQEKAEQIYFNKIGVIIKNEPNFIPKYRDTVLGIVKNRIAEEV